MKERKRRKESREGKKKKEIKRKQARKNDSQLHARKKARGTDTRTFGQRKKISNSPMVAS